MHILNQDKDMVFTLTDKGEIFSSMQTVNDVLMKIFRLYLSM